MKKIILPLLVISLFLTACSGSVNHMTSKQGFSIDYPSSWSAGPDSANGISFVEKATGGIIVASKNTIVDASKSSNASIISIYKEQKWNLLGSGDVPFGGNPGGYVEFENTYGINQFYHKDAWSVEGGSLYTIACTVNNTHKDTVKKVCDNMIASFKIEK